MSKSILISMNPEFVEKILNHTKTIEIRKTKPKCELPCKVYIYCTKGKTTIDYIERKGELDWFGNIAEKTLILTSPKYKFSMGEKLGKVIAEFTLNKVDTLERDLSDWLPKNRYDVSNDLLKDINLNQNELWNYGQGKTLYAWHIDDLKVYDKPKPLQVFFRPCGDCDKKDTDRCIYEDSYCRAKVIRPPKSYCYVEELENE